MEYYEKIDELDSIPSLISAIKDNLSGNIIIHNWEYVHWRCLDRYMVNIGYLLIEQKYLNYEKWQEQMNKILSPILKRYGCTSKGIEDIIKHVWVCRYYDKSLSDIASSRKPWYIRALANNIAIWISVILPLLIMGIIFNYNSKEHEYRGYPIIMLSINYAVVIGTVAVMNKYHKYMYTKIPIFLFVSNLIICAFAIFFSGFHNALLIDFIRKIIIYSLTYFITIPIIIINEDRIHTSFIHSEFKINHNNYY